MTKEQVIAELKARVERDCENLYEEELTPAWFGQERRLAVLRAWLRHSERELAEAAA
jgi:hypothetical protein